MGRTKGIRKRVNILIVSNALSGGAGKACHRLYHALRAKGDNVKLLQLEGRSSADPDVVSFYPSVRKLFRRQVMSFPLTVTKHIVLGDYQQRYRLPSSIHRLERHPLIDWADVINLHWVPEFLSYRKFFRRVALKPVVWTMHDMLPFAGGYHYETEMTRRSRRVERRIGCIKESAVRKANLSIVAPSTWLLRVSQRHPTFAGCPHCHIFNGLPLDVYRPIKKGVARTILGLPADRKIVLFSADSVGSTRKGGHHLVEALHHLNRPDILLLSVGRGRMEIDARFDYRHLGTLADEISMVLCYCSADLVTVPSVEDNSPNIIIESFACGRPVVAFDVGGVGELVHDPSLGVLVPTVNAEDFAVGVATALVTVFDESRIRADAVKRFSYDRLAENYSTVFGEITVA